MLKLQFDKSRFSPLDDPAKLALLKAGASDHNSNFNHQASVGIKVVRAATQLDRMKIVKPKIDINATLLNTSGTVFEQG